MLNGTCDARCDVSHSSSYTMYVYDENNFEVEMRNHFIYALYPVAFCPISLLCHFGGPSVHSEGRHEWHGMGGGGGERASGKEREIERTDKNKMERPIACRNRRKRQTNNAPPLSVCVCVSGSFGGCPYLQLLWDQMYLLQKRQPQVLLFFATLVQQGGHSKQ